MSKKSGLLNKIHLLFIILLGIANFYTTYGMQSGSSSPKTNKSASSTGNSNTEKDAIGNPLIISSNESVEKEFDQIRKYFSYDPATNVWSLIENFKTVEILEDSTQQRDDKYIYYSFWAYDTKHKKWKRVNIRNYGYKDGTYVPTPATEATIDTTTEGAEEEDVKTPSSHNRWKNLGLTFSVGGGETDYYNKLTGLNLMIKKANKDFYAQAPSSSDQHQGKAHLIRWFYDRNCKMLGVTNEGVAHDERSYEEIKSKEIVFRGMGVNIPITLGLHYTFFKKLRIGAGGGFEINYLKRLSHSGLTDYVLLHPWFYSLKWFGTAGYKVFQTDKTAIVIDTQLGAIFDLGDSPIKNLMKFIHFSFYGNLGVAYEHKLNDYFKLFYRLSGDFKKYNDDKDFIPSKATLELYQTAIHLEIGTILSFGRDTDDEEENANEDSSGSSLDKLDEGIQKAEQSLSQAEKGLNQVTQTKNRINQDKAKLKGLFKR